MQNQQTYTFPADLVQAVISTLNQAPAYQTRGLLNALEQACTEQDKAAQDKAAADAREAQKAEVRAELRAEAVKVAA
jgi:hypothetical protein